MSVIEFWEGNKVDIDYDKLAQDSLSVKGKRYHNPCRALEIFGNLTNLDVERNLEFSFKLSNIFIRKSHLALPSGFKIPLNDGVYHPPFVWKDCSPNALSINFTYMTNALYRILTGLVDHNLLLDEKVGNLLDEACLKLCKIYKLNNGYIMKNINNNINMFFISKVIESLVGPKIYNCEFQEMELTSEALERTLNSIDSYISNSLLQQMALALGSGITFFENFISEKSNDTNSNKVLIEERMYSYLEKAIVIDHRKHLIERIETANDSGKDITMCAILDDTSETVFDLLWMQHLIKRNVHLKLNLLLNRAQVSINFSSNMIQKILTNRHFKFLASKLNSQVFLYHTYCPLISFQTNILMKDAWYVINNSDFIYIKGLNFFETCQIKNKDTYYAFVVYGPVSCLYTGLNDFDAVFAFVPEGEEGFRHDKDQTKIKTLSEVTTVRL